MASERASPRSKRPTFALTDASYRERAEAPEENPHIAD